MKLPDLDLKDMALVAVLADTGQLSAAARHVGLSVSAASHRLSALEDRVGTTLFARRRGGMVPTAKGQRFQAACRRALEAARAASVSLVEEPAAIRVGSAWLMATTWLPPLLASASHLYPHRTIEVVTGRSREVARWVEEGRVEVGLVRATEARPGVRAFVVGADPVELVVPASHHWAAAPPDPEDLGRAAFVEVSADTGFGQFVADAKRTLGLSWTPAVRVDHLEAALALVEAGVGPALLPRSLVDRREPRRGGVATVSVPGIVWPQRPMALVVRAGEEMPTWAAGWPALLRSLVHRPP
jgi:DNA-binding transcriptional LysR family regulator